MWRLTDVQMPQRALPDSRLSAQVSFHQHGYAGSKAKITLRDGGKVLAARDVTLKDDGVEQTEAHPVQRRKRGREDHRNRASIRCPGEENAKNNKITRLVNVDQRKPRILYMEGEPRWEFKFLRRAVEDDRNIHLVTILRTTQNKIYVQDDHGDAPKNIKDGFPTRSGGSVRLRRADHRSRAKRRISPPRSSR